MNDSKLEIKEQRKGFFAKGITYLLLMIASLLVAFLPLLYSNAQSNALLFYIIGGISFALFTSLFAFLIYKECNPGNALILNSHGFKAKNHVGEDIEIEWTNVSSVKMLGKKETPFLGISLENCDIVIAKMRKKEADEMRENIEENLPHILISQNELRTSVREIKDLFVKFVREARALESDVPKKAKINPFSTDDVLRAFGKLPKESEQENESQTNLLDSNSEKPKTNIEINTEKTEPQTQETKVNEPIDNTQDTSTQSEDSFYSLLKQQLDVPVSSNAIDDKNCGEEVAVEEMTENKACILPEDLSKNDEEMPEELLAILSRAKSSKIDELGKILNDSTPVSFSQNRTDENTNSKESEGKIEIINDSQNDTVFGSLLDEDMLNMSSSVPDQSNEEPESDSFKIILPEELYDEKQFNDNVEISFDALHSLDNEASHIEANNKKHDHDDKTDTKEFYLNLLKINDNKSCNSTNDDDELIIPDLSEYND